jgi:hypothetical protein
MTRISSDHPTPGLNKKYGPIISKAVIQATVEVDAIQQEWRIDTSTGLNP